MCGCQYVMHTDDSVSANILHTFKSFRLDFPSFAPFTTFNFHPFVRCCFSTAMFWNISFILPVSFSLLFSCNPCVFLPLLLCVCISFFLLCYCFRHLNGWHFMSTKFSNNSKKENDIKIVC